MEVSADVAASMVPGDAGERLTFGEWLQVRAAPGDGATPTQPTTHLAPLEVASVGGEQRRDAIHRMNLVTEVAVLVKFHKAGAVEVVARLPALPI